MGSALIPSPGQVQELQELHGESLTVWRDTCPGTGPGIVHAAGGVQGQKLLGHHLRVLRFFFFFFFITLGLELSDTTRVRA